MSRKPRVGLAAYAIEAGGMETFLLRLAALLRDAGIEVEFLTTEWEGAWEQRIIAAGHPLNRIHASSPRELQRMVSFAVCAHRRAFDVLFLNHSVTAQSTIPFIPDRTKIIPIFHNDDRAIYDLGVRNSRGWDASVSVGTKVLREVRRRVPGKLSLHIPYGVPVPEPSTLEAVSTRSPGQSLLYVGRLEDRQKGVLHLPAILKGLQQTGMHAVRLTVVGDGPDRSELERRFDASGANSLVTLRGSLPPEDTLREMARHDILLMPSNYEGFPIALLEAMARGCVPVVSRLDGVTTDSVEDGVNGLFAESGSPETFVSVISKLAANPSAYKAMQLNAIRSIHELFSLERMRDAYMRLIDRAMAGDFTHERPRLFKTGWDRELIRPRDIAPFWLRKLVRTIIPRPHTSETTGRI